MAIEFSKSEKKEDGTTVVTYYRQGFLELGPSETKRETYNNSSGEMIRMEVPTDGFIEAAQHMSKWKDDPKFKNKL